MLGLIVRTKVTTDWSSALQGLRFQLAVTAIQSIDVKAHLEQNWRPQLLLLYQMREEELMAGGKGLPPKAEKGSAPANG